MEITKTMEMYLPFLKDHSDDIKGYCTNYCLYSKKEVKNADSCVALEIAQRDLLCLLDQNMTS